ncbi:cytochrome P450 [Actinoallomurus sp. NBC_01490]|jgi:cytochrome P450|uniref:cytochrome P450 n=1 Tax=Actinoallomurus sp. NBC_01490 TaxID=2903557 RepID=UPI002E36E675|nr:cytochrome P450 [Actinoallomurus sp. NBC_01490]
MAPSVFQRILEYANRADPYSLYAELRKTPVRREEDGTYVVSGYEEIVALLHDPHVSVGRPQPGQPQDAAKEPRSFLRLDPPEHDRLRRMAMRHFGPPHSPDRVDRLRPEMLKIITDLIDGVAGRERIDIVDDIAYPFPVTVICRILGVPREDEARIHEWADAVIESLDPREEGREERLRRRENAMVELHRYLGAIAAERRVRPGDDLLSGLVTDGGPDGAMSPKEVEANGTLLLIAGHETTVNLITNGMLTLLRHPELLDRLRHEPEMAIGMVEELLRYEPPVHLRSTRIALDDIDIAGTKIPKGAPIVLALAAGSRDPEHVPDPDRFDPDRRPNQHLGFGGGIHYCFGAPLARAEAQIALTELARRLQNPRLVTDPPPYRPSPELRGPRHLLLEIDGVAGPAR